MKKYLALALALLMVLALCAGCGDKAATSTGGDTSEEAYHAYLKEFLHAVPAVDEAQYPEFEALIDASDYTTMPADMMFNPQWWGYAAMTYDEFVAANGAYTIPEFDPDLVDDGEASGEPTGEPSAEPAAE